MPPQQSIIIPLDDLANTPEGHRETYRVSADINSENFGLPEGIRLLTPLDMKITLMKMKEGIHVFVEEANCRIGFKCTRCLEDSQTGLKISPTERIFYFSISDANQGDPNDIYLVNRRKMEIDLHEILRQEIILGIPVVMVCSSDCRGICPVCGKELNKNKCSCRRNIVNPDEQGFKKLSILRKMFRT